MKHYSELRKNMTEKQKNEADKLYAEYVEYLKSLNLPEGAVSDLRDDAIADTIRE